VSERLQAVSEFERSVGELKHALARARDDIARLQTQIEA
jgi:hypothetical protein